MAQAHRILAYFVANSWREHPVISGVINYRLFRLMVHLSLFNKVKNEVGFLRKQDNERRGEISKLYVPFKHLENKK